MPGWLQKPQYEVVMENNKPAEAPKDTATVKPVAAMMK